MKKQRSELIDLSELLEIHKKEDVILIDARSGQKANYLKEHLEGALFVDLNEDLSDIKDDFADGGRHPLPSLEQFSALLTQLGITPQSHVIVYDDKNGANAASRFWWMLKSIGHEKIQVLNGGLTDIVKAQFPISSGAETARKVALYPVNSWKLPLSNIDEVESILEDKNYIVIDVRAPKRYGGIEEPIDLIAGHIPGAINVPFASNLDGDGCFLTKPELKEKYQKIIGEKSIDQVIVHCGSGVTACHSLLAIAEVGLPIPKLYVGSWSEWSRNDKTMITV